MSRKYYNDNYFLNHKTEEIASSLKQNKKNVAEYCKEFDGMLFDNEATYDTYKAQWRMSSELVKLAEKEIAKREIKNAVKYSKKELTIADRIKVLTDSGMDIMQAMDSIFGSSK
jgi:hypothetical protein